MSNQIDKNNLKYFCIFGGGSIRGLSYVGAYKALKELGVEITGYAGSSVGSIAAALSALDYNLDEITDVFMKLDYALFKDINFSFKLELAISKGEIFTDKIRELICKKMNTDKPVCFKDFPKDLYVITTNLSKGKCVIFSKETTPDFEVAQAIRISAGFPGLLNPYELDGDLYVDGDLTKAYALSHLSPCLNPKNTRVLEFRLEGTKKHDKTNNPIVFMNDSFDFLSYMATDNIVDLYSNYDKYDFVVISTKNTLLFDFSIPKEKREQLINLGYNETMNYFKKSLSGKKARLCKEYSKMQEALLDAKKQLSENKNESARLSLLNYVFENYKNIKYLDDDFLNNLEEIVNLLSESTIKILFFKIKNDNHKAAADKINALTEKLKSKINELKNCIF